MYLELPSKFLMGLFGLLFLPNLGVCQGILNPALLWNESWFLSSRSILLEKKNPRFLLKKKTVVRSKPYTPKKIHGKEKGLPSRRHFVVENPPIHPAVQGRPCMA